MMDTLVTIVYLVVITPLTVFVVVGSFYMIAITIGDIIRGNL